MLAIIAGSNFHLRWKETGRGKIKTPFGPVEEIRWGELGEIRCFFLPRHGPDGKVPPHRINHRAHLFALKDLGVKAIIGVNSTGSLRKDLPPGKIVIPHDFLSPWSILSFFDGEAFHVTPSLDEGLREKLIEAAEKARVDFAREGVYVQTLGPRLETKAEIAMLKTFGHVVGMTMAHEATLACEIGVPYASICSVDNYAHGLLPEPLSQEEIARRARENAEKINRILEEFEGWES